VDLGNLLDALPTLLAVALGGLIARGMARWSSPTERTDEYRHEVRSAASAVVSAAEVYGNAVRDFIKSIVWIDDHSGAHALPEARESYTRCGQTHAALDKKVADFDFLIDVDTMSRVWCSWCTPTAGWRT